jgi:hypothetical protein
MFSNRLTSCSAAKRDRTGDGKYPSPQWSDSHLSFNVGDRVYYTGSDAKILSDYGNQALEIIALDAKTRRVVCQTVRLAQVVGIVFEDLSKR